MENRFYEQFYKTELEVIIGDVAKIIQKLGESVERYVTRFRTVQTKCTMVMTERDYIRLVQDGLMWLLLGC